MPREDTLTEQKSLGQIQLIANKINQLIEKHHIDAKTLSQATGISVGNINYLRRGEANPTLNTLLAITNYFNISLLELLSTDQHQSSNIVKIMVYNLSSIDKDKLGDPIADISVQMDNIEAENKRLFGIKLHNSGLSPFFEKGSIFIVSKDTASSDGDIVLVSFGEHAPCFRRIITQDKAALFKTIEMNSGLKESNDYYIYGTVIKIIQPLV